MAQPPAAPDLCRWFGWLRHRRSSHGYRRTILDGLNWPRHRLHHRPAVDVDCDGAETERQIHSLLALRRLVGTRCKRRLVRTKSELETGRADRQMYQVRDTVVRLENINDKVAASFDHNRRICANFHHSRFPSGCAMRAWVCMASIRCHTCLFHVTLWP